MAVRVASSSRLKTKKVGDRLAQAATTEDMGRLALESQQQQPQPVESSMESNYCAGLCLHEFPLNQDLSIVKSFFIVGSFLELFWNKYVEKEGDGLTLEQCFQAAIDVTFKRYLCMQGSSNHMQVAIFVLLHNGTRDIRIGNLSNARAITAVAVSNFFEQWRAIRSNTQYGWNWYKIHELCNALTSTHL